MLTSCGLGPAREISIASPFQYRGIAEQINPAAAQGHTRNKEFPAHSVCCYMVGECFTSDNKSVIALNSTPSLLVLRFCYKSLQKQKWPLGKKLQESLQLSQSPSQVMFQSIGILDWKGTHALSPVLVFPGNHQC